MQAAQVAQQTTMGIKQMEIQAELQKEQMRINGELEKERMRVESAERIAMASNMTKIQVATDTGDAKERSTDIAGIHSQLKQEIANQKPTSSSQNKQ
jgi:hypothetical protein